MYTPTSIRSALDLLKLGFPSELVSSVGCVIDIEYDASAGPLEDFKGNLSLCQWTFMARPRHPVMQQVVDSVTHILQQQTSADQRIAGGLGADILELTGSTTRKHFLQDQSLTWI